MNNISNTNNVFICGGGHQGFAMAAHLSLHNVNCTMWNRTFEHIKKINKTKKIICTGVVNGTAVIQKASSNIQDVISNFIMIVTPSNAHKELAQLIAPYANKDMVIILNPGRTFGAIEFLRELKKQGVKKNKIPHIAETQTIVYTCRKVGDNEVIIYALKEGVKIASIQGKKDIEFILNKLPECLRPYFIPTNSVYETSLSNVGMILHPAPVLMNIGWIETDKVDFKYYYDGISLSVANFLEKMDKERLKVAKTLGYKIESVSEWLRRTYNIKGSNLYECIHNNIFYKEIDAPISIKCRYLFEDIPYGLVPIENLGKKFNVPTPNITNIINLANSILNIDFRKIGRKL